MFSTCIIFAVEMKEMQFTAIVLTLLMTGILVFLLPGRVADDRVTNRSRWLMVGALGLIRMQFLIQYVTQLRAMGVTQAVLVNLTVLLPASALMDLAILNLQRQGRVSRLEQWGWIAAWLVVTGGLAIFVPLLIFGPNILVGIFALSFFWGIFMMWFSFVRYFTSNDIITTLRIDEAKHIIKEHHDWTNEAVADHCGFSRTHFQKIFKQETGVSLTDYQAKACV